MLRGILVSNVYKRVKEQLEETPMKKRDIIEVVEEEHTKLKEKYVSYNELAEVLKAEGYKEEIFYTKIFKVIAGNLKANKVMKKYTGEDTEFSL